MRDVVKTYSKIDKYNNQRSPQGSRRKKRKRNLFLYYVMIFLLILTTIVVLSLTVFFRIDKFSIVGNSPYSEEQLIDALGVKKGDNLFRLDIKALEDKAEKSLANVNTIHIQRSLPSELKITVEPSVPAANIQYNGQYFVVSVAGKIIEDNLSSAKDNLCTIIGFEPKDCSLGSQLKSMDENKESIVNEIFSDAEGLQFKGISEIDITDRLNIKLKYKNKINIQLGSSLDLKYKITFIQQIVEKNISPDFEGTIIMRGEGSASVIKKGDAGS